MTNRGTGRTTKMLLAAIEMLPNGAQYPLLIYGATRNHAHMLQNRFVDLVREKNIEVTMESPLELSCDGCRVEFRGFAEENSPLGKDYSHIYFDHYAEECELAGQYDSLEEKERKQKMMKKWREKVWQI